MATGELSNWEKARRDVRKTLVENDNVDWIVRLSGQLFANTQIPCALWFLSKNRDGSKGFRKRKGEILFIDANKMGLLMPGSRKQRQLSEEELEKIAATYRTFKYSDKPAEIPGFCKVATVEEIRGHKYSLSPGRYVGTMEPEDEDEPFEERMPLLVQKLAQEFSRATELENSIRVVLRGQGYGI